MLFSALLISNSTCAFSAIRTAGGEDFAQKAALGSSQPGLEKPAIQLRPGPDTLRRTCHAGELSVIATNFRYHDRTHAFLHRSGHYGLSEQFRLMD